MEETLMKQDGKSPMRMAPLPFEHSSRRCGDNVWSTGKHAR
jgi:hypothetical protein